MQLTQMPTRFIPPQAMERIASTVRGLPAPPKSGIRPGAVSRWDVPILLPCLMVVIFALAYANGYKSAGMELEYGQQYVFHSWLIVLVSFYVSILLNQHTVFIPAENTCNVLGTERFERDKDE